MILETPNGPVNLGQVLLKPTPMIAPAVKQYHNEWVAQRNRSIEEYNKLLDFSINAAPIHYIHRQGRPGPMAERDPNPRQYLTYI